MKTKNKITYAIAAIFAAIVIIFSSVIGGMGVAYAATSESYSGVLEDLKTDNTFNIDDYPRDSNDYSIQVIQVAESKDGELFVYTYQPCQYVYKLYATEINMALSESVDGTKLYSLILIDSRDTFCKYKVNDIVVSDNVVRYYNITSIYRPYDRYADGEELSSMNAIAFEVAQLWTAITTGGTIIYEMETIDAIEIEDLAFGSICVSGGTNLFTYSECDVHVIVFNTEIQIDKLLEADVEFDHSTGTYNIYDKVQWSELQHEEVTITYEEKGALSGHLLGDGGRTWDKIQTTSEFSKWLSNHDISLKDGDLSDALKNNKWVLAFWSSKNNYNHYGVGTGILSFLGTLVGAGALLTGQDLAEITVVKNVTVLRLEFITDGVHYNLGAVSNKTGTFTQQGSGTASDFEFSFEYVWNCIVKLFSGKASFFEAAVAVIVVVVALFVAIVVGLILFVYFPPLGQALIKAVMAVLKALLWLICLPFRGIAALVNKKKNKQGGSSDAEKD